MRLGRAACGPPSRSPSPRPAGRSRGSSRTDRPRQVQSSVAQRLLPSSVRAPWPIFWHSAAPHRSRLHSRARSVPRRLRISVRRSREALACSPTEVDRVCLASAQSSAAAGLPERSETPSPRNGLPSLQPCAIPRSRQIALIGLPCLKNARRIFAIVSTTNIQTSASKNYGSQCHPLMPGARFDADHPETGSFLHADPQSWLG